MAEVKPFRALRYDESKAGPLDELVAPPYDVISAEQREEYLARSPYNVVHLTLPDARSRPARDLADWREQGVLAGRRSRRYWWLSQDYVGPDGVARTRDGIRRLAPSRAVRGRGRPAARAHARGPKEGRLRLLRATRTQLEPIFLLYDGIRRRAPGARARSRRAAGDKLWRCSTRRCRASTTPQLLIADGHHRYETAVAFARGGRLAAT